ncbi:MAG: hypothetical protein HQM06_03385 [Magnetococcales bacterium]|nr:hypothetical protein [Magnetococcales bacterium]
MSQGQAAAVPGLGETFLHRCDPRAKLAALALLAPLLYRQPIFSWLWLGSTLLFLFVIHDALLHWLRSLGQQLWRLRWLFITLLLLHALLTPGEPLWSPLPWLTWQGLREGTQQLLRLLLMIAFAWVLVRTTTPMQWVTGFYRLFGVLQPLGLPVQQGCALLAFTLGSIPALLHETRQIREESLLRRPVSANQSWSQRMQTVADNGRALLLRLLQRAGAQEESLTLRGFAQGLPFVILHQSRWHWRDWLLTGWPLLLWLLHGFVL